MGFTLPCSSTVYVCVDFISRAEEVPQQVKEFTSSFDNLGFTPEVYVVEGRGLTFLLLSADPHLHSSP